MDLSVCARWIICYKRMAVAVLVSPSPQLHHNASLSQLAVLACMVLTAPYPALLNVVVGVVPSGAIQHRVNVTHVTVELTVAQVYHIHVVYSLSLLLLLLQRLDHLVL